jgi:hypothetical protein
MPRLRPQVYRSKAGAIPQPAGIEKVVAVRAQESNPSFRELGELRQFAKKFQFFSARTQRFEGLANWRLHCTDEAEELLGRENQTKVKHAVGERTAPP